MHSSVKSSNVVTCRFARFGLLGFQEYLLLQSKALSCTLIASQYVLSCLVLYCAAWCCIYVYPVLVVCRFANAGPLGFQEKLMLQNKAKEAMEKGEKPPNEPGMQQAIKDLEQNGGKTIGEMAKEQQE